MSLFILDAATWTCEAKLWSWSTGSFSDYEQVFLIYFSLNIY